MQNLFLSRALIVLMWALPFSATSLCAQFSQARLQAIGLTCALCSKAIHESLIKLPFVDSVHADIKSSAFDVKFKTGLPISTEDIRAAVEESGFFVGSLELKISSPSTAKQLSTEGLVKSGDYTYQLLENWEGLVPLQVLGKGFMPEKDYKKKAARYSSQIANKPASVFLLPKNK